MLSRNLRVFIVLLGLSFGLGGCATAPSDAVVHQSIEPILSYYNNLPSDHPDRLETLLSLPEHAKQLVKLEFEHYPKSVRGAQLAMWLMAPEDHDLNYDVNANLIPSQVFQQRRGNCLSFSLLLQQLAKELDLELHLNQVDLPDMWGQSNNQDLIFYRHVNALQKNRNHTRIFDLALENYRPGLPQRVLTQDQGVALLFSNLGIQFLQNNEPEKALHYLMLAASLYPNNPDMWVNLGSAYKKSQQWSMAERTYLMAFDLDDSNSLAASNLDRLYRLIKRPNKAKVYANLAQKARMRNPYIRFERARTAFAAKRYSEASKNIKHAIKLHAKDPQFFELSSRIKQAKKSYVAALKDLEKAHNLSTDEGERLRYAGKVEMVLERVKQQMLAKAERSDKSNLEKLLSDINVEYR